MQRALEISHAPFLDAAGPLESEIREFLAHKVRQNESSRDGALEHLARFVNQRDSALVSTGEGERFYRAQQVRSANPPPKAT